MTGTFADYIEGHPDTAATLDAVRRAIEHLGPFTERLTKSQLAFVRRRTFATAWAAGQYLGDHRVPLVLTFDFDQPDLSGRWKQIVEVHPGHVAHHVELHGPDDVDAQLVQWLERSYADAG